MRSTFAISFSFLAVLMLAVGADGDEPQDGFKFEKKNTSDPDVQPLGGAGKFSSPNAYDTTRDGGHSFVRIRGSRGVQATVHLKGKGECARKATDPDPNEVKGHGAYRKSYSTTYEVTAPNGGEAMLFVENKLSGDYRLYAENGPYIRSELKGQMVDIIGNRHSFKIVRGIEKAASPAEHRKGKRTVRTSLNLWGIVSYEQADGSDLTLPLSMPVRYDDFTVLVSEKTYTTEEMLDSMKPFAPPGNVSKAELNRADYSAVPEEFRHHAENAGAYRGAYRQAHVWRYDLEPPPGSAIDAPTGGPRPENYLYDAEWMAHGWHTTDEYMEPRHIPSSAQHDPSAMGPTLTDENKLEALFVQVWEKGSSISFEANLQSTVRAAMRLQVEGRVTHTDGGHPITPGNTGDDGEPSVCFYPKSDVSLSLRNTVRATYMVLEPGIDDPEDDPPAEVDPGEYLASADDPPMDVLPPEEFVATNGGGVAIRAESGIGLQGQLGWEVGLLEVEFESACTTDTLVHFEPTAPGVVQVEEYRLLRAGQRTVVLPVIPLVEDSVDVEFELRSSDESEIGPVNQVLFAPTSTTAVSETHVRLDSQAEYWILPGKDFPPITLRRSGFDDIATESTTVLVAYDDPDSILAQAPTSVIIPAGATTTELLLISSQSSGTAVATFTHGVSTWQVSFGTTNRRVDGLSSVVVPIGGTLEIRLDVFPDWDAVSTSLGVEAGAPFQATLLSSSVSDEDRSLHFVQIESSQIGTGSATFSVNGSDEHVVEVEVVPESVKVSEASVSIPIPAQFSGGTVRVRLPSSGVFVSAVPQQAASGVLSLTGVGTPELEFSVDATASPLSTLFVDVVLSNVLPGAPIVVEESLGTSLDGVSYTRELDAE